MRNRIMIALSARGDARTPFLLTLAVLAIAASPLHGEDKGMERYGELKAAVYADDAARLAELVRGGVDPNLRDGGEHTALMIAVEKAKPDMVRALLGLGADPRARNYEGTCAAGYAPFYTHKAELRPAVLECLDLLFAAGFTVDEPVDGEGSSLLARAAGSRADWAVGFLLARGASPARANDSGVTPLMYMVYRSRGEGPVLPTIRLLVDAGADAGTDDDGRSLFYHAARTSDAAAALYALERFGDPALGPSAKAEERAAYAQDILYGFLEYLSGDDAGSVKAFIEALVALGADPGGQGRNGEALILRPRHGGAAADAAVMALVDLGAPIDAVDSVGRTPLSLAAEAGNDERTRLLAARGADVNTADTYGDTPLMKARDAAVVERLLEAGADIAARDQYGDTALHHLAKWADRLPAVRLLVEAGADSNAADNSGETVLMDALGWKGEDSALFLLGLGADALARDEDGKTALEHYVDGLWRDGEASVAARYRPDVLEALVAAGADPASRDDDGESPLLVCLREDPDRALALTADLAARTDPAALKEAEAVIAKENSDRFFRNVDYHAGEIAFAIGLPIAILGLSVWLREGVFAGNPGGNWMAPVNSVLACASGLALTGAVVIGGGMYGLTSSGSSSGGMEAIGIGVATGAGGILGLALGTIAGIIVGLLPDVRNAFADSGLLYYVPSGISVVVSGAMLASIFK